MAFAVHDRCVRPSSDPRGQQRDADKRRRRQARRPGHCCACAVPVRSGTLSACGSARVSAGRVSAPALPGRAALRWSAAAPLGAATSDPRRSAGRCVCPRRPQWQLRGWRVRAVLGAPAALVAGCSRNHLQTSFLFSILSSCGVSPEQAAARQPGICTGKSGKKNIKERKKQPGAFAGDSPAPPLPAPPP